jgi:hypothetical protein
MRQQRAGLPLQNLSNNLRRMPRWYLFLSAIVLPAVAFACNDDVVQEVDPEVCISGMQWIGGKRGSPEMYPGRDCLGCHLENDGPELMLGGTVYPYVELALGEEGLDRFNAAQTGQDCFGLPEVNVKIRGGDGQLFEVVTNRAGNFFIEGKATDLEKPFSVELEFDDAEAGFSGNPTMNTTPSYGGCARCHTPGVQPTPPDFEGTGDEKVVPAYSFIGIPGYKDVTP